MGQRLNQLAIVAGVIASVGCNRSPAGPDSGGSTSNGSRTTPPVRGLVREANGGPVAGVTVVLAAQTGFTVTQRSPKVVSDETGIFLIPPSSDLCGANNTAWFEASKAGYLFQPPARIRCTSDLNPPEVTVEVKGQRAVTAVAGAPVEITLSNDDLNWLTDENGYSCGPCKIVALELPPQGPVAIRVEWSGPNPIFVWVEGDRWAGDLVRLREVIPPFGASDANLTIPIEWRELYLVLKVGLPYGGRFPAGSPPVRVRIEVR